MKKSKFTIQVQNKLNEKGLSYSNVAKKLNVSKNMIYNYVYEKNKSIKFINYLIDELGFSYEEIRELKGKK